MLTELMGGAGDVAVWTHDARGKGMVKTGRSIWLQNSKKTVERKNGPKQKLRKGIKNKVNTGSIECKGLKKHRSQQV